MYRDTLRLFWSATWKYKWVLLVSEIGTLGLILGGDILSPYIISKVIDKLSAAPPSSYVFGDFLPLLYAFAGLQLLAIVSGRLMMFTYIWMEPRIIRDLENLSFKKLLGHSMAFFADNFSGALVAKVNRFTASYQRFLETTMADLFNFFLRYVISLIAIWLLSPFIALTFLGWTIFFCASLYFLHRWKSQFTRAASSSQTRVTARLADIIANTLTIRSFARSRDEERHFKGLTDERLNLRRQSYLAAEYIRIYKVFVIAGLEGALLVFSIKAAISGSISVGAVILIQFYLFRLIGQLWDFGRYMDRVEEALSDSVEMTEIIMQPHDVVDIENPEKCVMPHGKIEFRDVGFQYPEVSERDNLFSHFSLTIPAGQKVGLVGPSGGGKTTLTKLLLRFMDIQEGELCIDGQNIANVAQEDLRRHIAYVPQEPLLFHRTVYENIGYGKPDATEVEVFRAAKRAHADEFIQQLSKQYDTVVGERGVKLSGGQRQRVAIARAMLKEAPIIILDEATSSLDSVSERLITDALDQLMEKRTTLVIAHRLSTIRKLDRILVLSEGCVVEDGNHTELLEKNGLYAKLWAHQSGDFIGED